MFTTQKIRIAAVAALAAVAFTVAAETMKGRVDAIDAGSRTIQLNGISFQATGETTFSGISGLQDLQAGDRIAIDFRRDGARYVVNSVSRE